MKTNWKIVLMVTLLVAGLLSACGGGVDPEVNINREELSPVQKRLFDLYPTSPEDYIDGYVIMAIDTNLSTYWVGGNFTSKDGSKYDAILNYWPHKYESNKGEKVFRQRMGGYYYIEEPDAPDIEDLACDVQDVIAPENWAAMVPSGYWQVRYLEYHCIYGATP